MDKEKFRQFLEEVAEVVDMNDYGPNGRTRQTNRDPNKKEYRVIVEVDEDGEEYEVLEEIHKHDPNLGIVVKSIKPVMRACHLGCGAVIADQIIEKRLAYTPYKHYRTRCANCHMYQSPIDGSMVDSKEIGDEFYRLKRHRDK